MQHILKPGDIQYFHTENDHVIAVTETDSYILKEKLYELEYVQLFKNSFSFISSNTNIQFSFKTTRNSLISFYTIRRTNSKIGIRSSEVIILTPIKQSLDNV